MAEETAPAPAPEPPPVADPVVVEDAQGQRFTIDAGETGAYLRSGQYAIAQDQYQATPGRGIPVTRGGQLEFLPPEQADAAIRSFDAEGMPSAQVDQAEEGRHYGGALQGARAFSAGMLRMGTLGLSDQALTAIDPTLAPDLAGLARHREGATMAGEAVGTILPFLAGPGVVGRALGAPVRGLSGLAEGVGALGARAARAVGAPAGTAIARGASTIARTATEFAGFEGGRELSQAALEQRELDGEKMVAAMKHGAMMGAALGLGGTVLSSAARGAGGYVADKVAGRVGEATAGLRDAAEGATEAGRGLLDRGAGFVREGVEKAKGAAEGACQRLEREGVLDAVGRDQAIKSTGANLRQVEALEAMGPDMKDRAIRQVLDLGKADGKAILSRAEMAERAGANVETTGSEVGKLIKDMSKAGVKTDMTEFLSSQRRAILDKLGDVVDPELRAAGKKMEETWFSEIEKSAASGDPSKLWETKSLLGKRINWKAGTEDVANELKKDLYFGLDREITRLGTESAEKMGADFSKTWRGANDEYRAARWVRDATDKGAASETRNNVFGAGELLVGGAALASGGLAAVPIAIGGAILKNIQRRYGSQAVSQALLRPGALDAMIAQVDNQIGGQVRGMLGRGKAVAEGALDAGRPVVEQGAAKARGAIEGAAQRIGDAAEGVAKVAAEGAERTAKAVRAGAGRAAEFSERRDAIVEYQKARATGAPSPLPREALVTVDKGAAFLASKLPQRAQVATIDAARDAARLPTEIEQARWLRYARAIDDPLGVLEDAKHGRLSREALEAIRAVYPRMYGAVVAAGQAAIAERGNDLTATERRNMGALLGLPATRASNPATVAAVQAALAGSSAQAMSGAGGAPQPPAKAPTRPMKGPSASLKSDRIEGGTY